MVGGTLYRWHLTCLHGAIGPPYGQTKQKPNQHLVCVSRETAGVSFFYLLFDFATLKYWARHRIYVCGYWIGPSPREMDRVCILDYHLTVLMLSLMFRDR